MNDAKVKFRELGIGIEILQGFAFSSGHFSEKDGLPLVRIRDLESGITETRYSGPYSDEYVINLGDVLIGMDGDFKVVRWSGERALLNQRVCRVRSCTPAVDDGFLFHAIQPEIERIHRLTPQTTVRHLSSEGIRACTVLDVALDKQRRIAEILDTIDEAIQATERVIAKRTAMLSGFVEALVGRTNQITTARRHLGELLQLRMDYRGRTPKKLGMDWGDGQIPALSANNVQMGRIDFGKECYLGSDDLYQRWMTQGDLKRGDLLITMEAPLGNIARVPDDHRYILSQRVVLLRFSPDVLLNDFAYWYLRSESFQSELQRRSTGTTATGVRRAELERIEIPLIDLPQQKALSDSLSAHEKTISREQQVLRKLDEMRAGLAADLLSGRVRAVAR